MGAWEAGAAADQEHRAPTALNAACVSAATDNESFEGARASTAVMALSASTGSGEKQAADSMPRGAQESESHPANLGASPTPALLPQCCSSLCSWVRGLISIHGLPLQIVLGEKMEGSGL